MNYKEKYKKYKTKYIIKRLDMAGGNSHQKLKDIDMKKEVIKRVPKIDPDFINLYFAVKAGLLNYLAKNDKKPPAFDGEKLGNHIIDMAMKQISNKLKKDDKLVKMVVEGLNKGKESGKTVKPEEILDYAKVFTKLFNKRKKKKGPEYSHKRFSRYLIGLIVKLYDAEYDVLDDYGLIKK